MSIIGKATQTPQVHSFISVCSPRGASGWIGRWRRRNTRRRSMSTGEYRGQGSDWKSSYEWWMYLIPHSLPRFPLRQLLRDLTHFSLSKTWAYVHSSRHGLSKKVPSSLWRGTRRRKGEQKGGMGSDWSSWWDDVVIRVASLWGKFCGWKWKL